MKITKYEHACVLIEEQGRHLVIDPGVFSSSFNPADTIDSVIVTHVHPDHFDPEKLRAIKQMNPDAMICTVQEVADQIKVLSPEVVDASRSCSHGPFHISFFGGVHAEIHPSYPEAQNIGVFINEAFYYPGDSLVVPDVEVRLLAAPAAAPWMKASEAMDFVTAVKAEKAFPTHDVFLSDDGRALYDRLLGGAAENANTSYTSLKPGESLEI